MATKRTPAAKKAAAKKVPAKQAAEKKSAAKKASPKKVAGKKVAKSVPAKKAAKSVSVRTAAKKVPAKKAVTRATTSPARGNASQLIDARIKELGDWRGEMLSRIRTLIRQADPEVVEEWKWRGTPVWSRDGIICTGETYKSIVKLTFMKGASLADPARLFNSSLDGNVRRAIDIHEDEKLNERALGVLIQAAIALNTSSRRR